MNEPRTSSWRHKAKMAALILAVSGLSYLVGLHIIAPSVARGADEHLPAAVVNMPAHSATIIHSDGDRIMIPIRLASTSSTRKAGLSGVGPKALETSFLLYAQTSERTSPTTYDMTGIRAPLEAAVIDGQGQIVAIERVAMNSKSLRVSERHRWLLVAREGLLSHYGIGVGSTMDTALRKIPSLQS